MIDFITTMYRVTTNHKDRIIIRLVMNLIIQYILDSNVDTTILLNRCMLSNLRIHIKCIYSLWNSLAIHIKPHLTETSLHTESRTTHCCHAIPIIPSAHIVHVHVKAWNQTFVGGEGRRGEEEEGGAEGGGRGGGGGGGGGREG